MSTRGWSGQPPTSTESARERLMDAALACLQRYGLEKTVMGDIAAAAGVTKPTIYAYFESRDDLLHSALTRAGLALGARLIEHARRFPTPADQLVEAVLFCLREIPNEPGLAVTSRSQSDGFGTRVGLHPSSESRQLLFCAFESALSSADRLFASAGDTRSPSSLASVPGRAE